MTEEQFKNCCKQVFSDCIFESAIRQTMLLCKTYVDNIIVASYSRQDGTVLDYFNLENLNDESTLIRHLDYLKKTLMD